MSKRFTETNIWNEDWFLEMPKNYKLLYFFVKDNCDHAGIWRPNVRLFEAMIEDKVDLKKAFEYFNNGKERIYILDCGKWFIIDFFVFQYGCTFNPLNRVHKSIENIYNQLNINLTSIRGLKDLKDGVKDKDKDKDKDKEEISIVYSIFYDKEILLSNNDVNYTNFIKVLFGENSLAKRLDRVLKMQDQVTFEQFKVIYNYREKYKVSIGEYLVRMENWKDLTKKNSSVQQTLLTWIRKDKEK